MRFYLSNYGVKERLVLNALFWVLYFGYPFLVFRYTGEHTITLKEILFYFLFYGSILYFNNLYLLPRYFRDQNLVKYLSVIIPILIASSFLEAYVNKTILKTCTCEGPNSIYALYNFIHLGVLIVLFSTVLLILSFSDKIKALEKAENDRLSSELKFLKSQVNPHLLFNSLNSIYSYALKNAKETPEMVMKLSDLLRFMLYEADKPKVRLSQEWNYLLDYIALQKMRKEAIQVELENQGDLEEIEITPLILINFVENAFKYVDPYNPMVKLSLKASKEEISFYCSNTFQSSDSKNRIELDSNGLGLNNAKKLLSHSYTDCHELNISDSNNIFKIYLRIKNELPGN